MSRLHGFSRVDRKRNSDKKGMVRRCLIEQLESRHLLASDYLLVIEGVKGESKDEVHPGAIEIQSFSWGASNTGRQANRQTTEEFRFVTNTSIASPLLYQAAAQGKHFTKAVLYARKAGGGQPDFMKVEMKEVLISSFQTRSLNEELPKEEIAFDFSSITQQVTSTNEDGTPGQTITTSWSIPRRAQTADSDSLLSQQPSSNRDQTDTFLLIDGIKGDSRDAAFPDAIPIESFSWGTGQTSSNRGRATFQDMHFVSEISKASPMLARAAATGQHISNAQLVVRKSTPNGTPHDYIKITLSDVIISSYSTAAGSGTSPMDEIQISFGNIVQAVSAEDATGSTTVVSSKLSTRNAVSTEADDLIDNTIPTAAAADFLLEIDGIDGESTVTDHKGAIELNSFSWGVSQPGIIGIGGGGGSGKVSLQDFHFTSNAGAASPLLFTSTAAGEHIAKAVLTVRKSGSDPQGYIKYKLQDVIVSSYRAQGMNNQLPTDQFSLSFDDLTFVYQPPASANGQAPAPIKMEWDAPRSVERIANSVIPFVTSTGAAERSAGYYLKFDGIDGESTEKDHNGEIEVLSWSFGVSQSDIRSTRSGLSAGKVSFQDFHFVSPNSQASPKLYDKIFSNPSPNERTTLSVRRSDAEADYLKIRLSAPDLRSLKLQSTDHSQPLEEYGSGYLKMEMRYAPPTGAIQGIVVGSAAVRANDDQEESEALIGQTNPIAAGADFVLKIDGISGESSDETISNGIDVQSFSWGVSQALRPCSGCGAGKVSLQDFHFVMDSSTATPQLLQAFALGKLSPNAVLVSRASDPPKNYIKVQLKEVFITSYQTQGQAGTAPTEEVALNFAKIGIQVAGANGSAPVSSSLDFSRMRGQIEFEKGDSILSISAPSQRATDYFLKIDGIKGESKAKEHKEWIDIQSFSWGASREVSNGRRLGGIKFEGLSFGTETDTTSPQLLLSHALGNRIPNVQLEITAPGGRTYLKYELRDVIISSYSLSGSESDDTDFGASFGRLSVTASPPATENAKGAEQSQSVDIYYGDQDEFIPAKKRR